MKSGVPVPDVASDNFQILEDLATAAWNSEVLFAALELGVFDALSDGPVSVEYLATRLGCDGASLERLMAALAALGLVTADSGQYENSPLSARYLARGSLSNAEDILDYRRFLANGWKRLASRIRDGIRINDRPETERREAYEERVFAYVRAMDFQARIKAADAVERLALIAGLQPVRVLDVGGGAGTWCRALRAKWPQADAVLFDLPEVILAARKLYPDPVHWIGIETYAGDARDLSFGKQSFDLIVLSNILHAYGRDEAGQLLIGAAQSLSAGGLLLIHDYLADGHSSSPLKGRLYDLHMMLNTYNGRIYEFKELESMLDAAGLGSSRLFHLGTDTSIVLAQNASSSHQTLIGEDLIEMRARSLGFDFARVIKACDVAVRSWVRIKCEKGCSRYGASLTCPPHSPDEQKMREILSEYTHALLIQATPPSKQFHDRLLSLERLFLLNGYPEALAFGAGPCPVCPTCSPDGKCRCPEKARPSLEACGVDVYETARRAGLSLEPVRDPLGYVRYIGVVLFNRKEESCASC